MRKTFGAAAFMALLAVTVPGAVEPDRVLLDERDTIAGWSYAEPVAEPVKTGAAAARWVNADKGGAMSLKNAAAVFCYGEALTFWLHSAVANNAEFLIVATSPGPNGDGDYYLKKITVDWQGWKELRVPLADFDVSRSPSGWNKVTKLQFCSNGWGAAPKADTVWHVDAMRLTAPVQSGKDAGYSGSPADLDALGGRVELAVDPRREHIYGIEWEARGPSGITLQPKRGEMLGADGVTRHSIGYGGGGDFPFFRFALGDEWKVCRMELLTKRGDMWLRLLLDQLRDGKPVTGGKVQIRNIHLVDGGFPASPPVPGAPYLDWIESLKPNPAYAKANPYFKPGQGGFPKEELERRKREVAPYMELSAKRLMELMPERRFFDNLDEPAPWQNLNTTWNGWDPREPDVLRNEDGSVLDVAALYPVTGVEKVLTPSGKTVEYAYHDPSPAVAIKGDILFPKRWRVFGPVKEDAALPTDKALASMPATLTVGVAKLTGRDVELSAAGELDLAALLGGYGEGMTCYAFAELAVPAATEATIGAGVDWWMTWWVDGVQVFATPRSGNDKWPPRLSDWTFPVKLTRGRHVLAVRLVSGSGSYRFAAGGPAELRRLGGTDAPKDRVQLDRFMTFKRVSSLTRAAYIMAALYRSTGDREYALRSAAILTALARAIPDWPIYGKPEVVSRASPRFFPPDSYEFWSAFIVGGWYNPSMGFAILPAKAYDLVREAPVWDEVSRLAGADARAIVDKGLLHMARMCLKYDAYNRSNPWKLYHNTIGTAIGVYLLIGRVIGCPELIHHAVAKTATTYKYTYMADGMFPESTSYHGQMTGEFEGAVTGVGHVQGYSDPPGFTAACDGRRFDNFDIRKEIPLSAQSVELMRNGLTFPDFTSATIHDTWATSAVSARLGAKPREASSLLIPDFGHARLGWGARPQGVEALLHYSGAYGHRHFDMLNFTLWAYGDELTADIGYSHLSQYLYGTASHNLVVVDGLNQNSTHRGDLLAWHVRPGAAQVEQASDNQAYPLTRLYRRTIVGVPFAPGRDAVVDIFEVDGGARHEWMANGCADYAQKVETDFAPNPGAAPYGSLAADGSVLDGKSFEGLMAEPGKKYEFYGAFRRTPARLPWRVTMTPAPPVPPGTPGAGPRATTAAPRPGLRLHGLSPAEAEPMLCWAPRHRYCTEPSIWAEPDKYQAWWGKNLMPKVVVRREGRELSSVFVAVWEPFMERPWLSEAVGLDDIPARDGVGVRLKSPDGAAMILCRRPESAAVLKADGLELDGRFAVFRHGKEGSSLDLYDGARASTPELAVAITPWPKLEVVGQEQRGGVDRLLLKGRLPGYPADPANQPHVGGLVRFAQEGQAAWWLPVSRVDATAEGDTWLTLSRAVGFSFDPKSRTLRETFFPFRVMTGAATVEFPSGANVAWSSLSAEAVNVRLATSAAVELRFPGQAKRGTAKIRRAGAAIWADLPVKREADALILAPPLELLGNGWNEIELK